MQNENLPQVLWHAVETGDLQTIRNAVIKGADVEARDMKERTAINIASQNGQVEAMKTLLAAKSMARIERLGLPLVQQKAVPTVSKKKASS